MRQIKFRGKRVDNGEWVYGFYVQDPLGNHRIYYKPFEECTSNTYHFVAPATVGQFTGLLDKNGNEIYEGEGLVGVKKRQDDKEGVHVIVLTDTVRWNNGGFIVFGREMQRGYTKEGGRLYQFMWVEQWYNAHPTVYFQIDDIEISPDLLTNH